MAEKYKEAGVDLEAGYESVRRIKSHVARTKVKGAIDSIGAFGGMFDLSAYGMKEPVLVSGTDGVGTKLMLAFEMDKHDTIGIDAVAMCVNDVLVQGAAPIFFLDYIAVGQNKPEVIEQIVQGVADGCVDSECALIGGETAEMPDMYAKDHYDLAGFCVGAVDKSKLKDSRNLKVGDVLIGLPSSGVHSNGFSLVRKVLFKDNHLDPHAAYEELDGQVLGDVLLTPTKFMCVRSRLCSTRWIFMRCLISRVAVFMKMCRVCSKTEWVSRSMRRRSLVRRSSILSRPKGQIDWKEMYNVFNMGIGFIIAVDPKDVDTTRELLKEVDQESYVIGTVTDRGEVEVKW